MNETATPPEAPAAPPKKGDELELTVESLAFGGQGIARHHGLVVFLDKGKSLPGSTVRARITKKRKGFAEARVLEVLKASPDAVEAPCAHFGVCGGCTTQNLTYEAQLAQKQAQVADLFGRMGHFTDLEIQPIIGCKETFNYRNKMEFTWSNRAWLLGDEDPIPDRALGLHVPGRYDKVLDIEQCHLQHLVAGEVYTWIKAHTSSLEPYDIKAHSGFLRHLVIRTAEPEAGKIEIMVNFVTSREDPAALKPLAEGLAEKFPQVVSVVNNINTRRAAVAYGEWEVLLHGRPSLTMQLRGLTFEVSANAFFQTNSAQAELLLEQVEAACALTGEEVVYDLFCGTGAIALMLARQAKEVAGFESVTPAVDDATRNAMVNEIFNVRFFLADLGAKYFTHNLQRLLKQVPRPDIVVADPPRAGFHPKLVEEIADLGPRKVVYVSCNPATQVRDVVLLAEAGYRPTWVQPVDMFPHTPHIENICILER